MNYRAPVIVFLVLVIGGIVGQNLILGGRYTTKLASAPALSGAIAQALDTTGNNAPLAVDGKDYSIKDVEYFDNNQWVVASLMLLRTKTDPGVIVMREVNGSYQLSLGPGTAFTTADVQNIPANVVRYVQDLGVLIYVSPNE